jgi:putative oxygen-independent coproporphyrinogen III oxidase
MRPISFYIHIPFCQKKCGYCDFNAYSGYKENSKRRYVDALKTEIALSSPENFTVQTIFFGGGTPSFLPAEWLVEILESVFTHHTVLPNAEISLEANPNDANLESLTLLRKSGFNRISFGVQTFNNQLLTQIDRTHSDRDAENAILLAKQADFDNISIDLMFGLPYQTIKQWDESLTRALALRLPHLSLYGLILEEGTPFWGRHQRGKLPLPTEDKEVEMLEMAIEHTQSAGYTHYEISNYAKPGFACVHNHTYWQGTEYLGLGAGASGYLGGTRYTNEPSPTRYINRLSQHKSVIVASETLSLEQQRGEAIMLGLRMRKGIALADFERRFACDAATLFAPQIAHWQERGLLEVTNNHLKLTDAGVFLASEVMADFL